MREFTFPNKNTDKEMGLNLNIISDDEVECYNKSESKPVHTIIDDELQLLPKEKTLTIEQGIYIRQKLKTVEPSKSVSKSKSLYAKKPKN